jgi:hypothetical protein
MRNNALEQLIVLRIMELEVIAAGLCDEDKLLIMFIAFL